jgi:hypothetical protein
LPTTERFTILCATPPELLERLTWGILAGNQGKYETIPEIKIKVDERGAN